MNIYVYPYKFVSKSAKALAKALDISLINPSKNDIKDHKDMIIINWGSGDCPYKKAKVINKAEAVNKAVNKASFFHNAQMHNIVNSNNKLNIPESTNAKIVAEAWINNGHKVIARTIANGSQSKGLVVASTIEALPKASLYTKYIPNWKEYRIHILNDKVIRREKKVWPSSKKSDPDHTNRSAKDGWVFEYSSLDDTPRDVNRQALLAIKMIGLDFGGVDVIWNKTHSKATVLEVNTAPGIEDYDLKAYNDSFRDYLKTLVS